VRLDESWPSGKPSEVQPIARRTSTSGGSLYEEEARYLVRANNEFKDTADILDTIL
jgi:hypothetical protein